ncbi:FkbM family methyltransferase [Paenibacillus gorillae]|uniref:FkbM family methyltransferase n=1 Tax=Paenibacillus gorillae TaxID=1243662 RepID=UPI0004B5A3B1|nr:FkbM family methyltransferase [Paenibacillus gorillae]
MKWYIEPITHQQTDFNNAVVPAVGRITELVRGISNNNIQLEQLYTTAVQEIEWHKKQSTELSEKLERAIASLNQAQEQQNIMSIELKQHKQDFENVKKRHYIYEEQSELTTRFIKKIEALQLFGNVPDNFFEKTSYAQSGEDSILAYILHVLGISFVDVTYIDLGANHAKELSNTYFMYSKGAKGVLVEANVNLVPELQFYRHRDIVLNNCIDVETGKQIDFYVLNGDGLSTPDLNAANAFIEKNPDLKIVEKKVVETVSYETIVDNYLGKAPTILSIDIEGKDMEVLKSINYDNSRPLLIVTEMISYDIKLNHRSKNDEIKQFLESKGYEEYAFTGINSIFLDGKYSKNRVG